MRRLLRVVGTLMVVGGLATLAWVLAVWRWEDPFTSIYTQWEQRTLSQALEGRFAEHAGRAAALAAAEPGDLAAAARGYRRATRVGEGIGRLEVPRLGLDVVFVYGTDPETLKRGPGLDPRTYFPGQSRLVYVAGHRTTYGAPFSKIDALRRGDAIRVEMPYATFTYRVTGSRVVAAADLSVLRSKRFEQIALQACHPRFFASHRWITYGRLASVSTPGGEEVLRASAD